MGDTVAELNATLASIPKNADTVDKAALDAIDPDKVKSKLQKQLKEERGITARLSKELDLARAKIAGQASLLGMIRLADEQVPPAPTPGPNKRAEDAELRATKAERRVAELEIDVHALTMQVAFHQNATKDVQATVKHERDHARAAEQQVRDTRKATDEDIRQRVAVQIGKAKDAIHAGGYRDGYRAAMEAPEVKDRRAKRAAEQAAEEASEKAYQERIERILAAMPGPRTPEKELLAAIEAAGQ